LRTLANGASTFGVSYRDPPRAVSRPLWIIAWAFIALGSSSFLFLASLQTMMLWPFRYIDAYVAGSLLFFLAFGLLEAGAIWATLKRRVGVSIALGGFVGLFLGLVSLGILVWGINL
jgi:hypothetical protein